MGPNPDSYDSWFDVATYYDMSFLDIHAPQTDHRPVKRGSFLLIF
jgi:hypothetical protein